MASTIFEGLDSEGKRVINLHVPYDNGVVYWMQAAMARV